MRELSAEERSELEAILAEKRHIETGLTNKEALRTLQYEIAEIRWKLGEISDEELTEAEEFLSFNFDF
jgi:hypothetical protein